MAVSAPYEVLDLTRTNRVPLHSSAPANTASYTSGYSELDRSREEGSSGPTVPAGERLSTYETAGERYSTCVTDTSRSPHISINQKAKKYAGGIQITLLTVIVVLLVACFIGVFFQGTETKAMVTEIKTTLEQISISTIPSSCTARTGSWMRVGYLDMTQNSHQCPSGLEERVDLDIRTCVSESDSAGCTSVFYPTTNINYFRVCARVTGYQIGETNAFRAAELKNEIDSPYVDGVSLTHGNNPRQHIWTFAAGRNKRTNSQKSNCPCQTNSSTTPPNFVGNDSFCDFGSGGSSSSPTEFYTDPLWDGTDCTCCNDPPWFYKQLPQPTTDDIEMRLCRNQARDKEDIAIQLIEIYIQ